FEMEVVDLEPVHRSVTLARCERSSQADAQQDWHATADSVLHIFNALHDRCHVVLAKQPKIRHTQIEAQVTLGHSHTQSRRASCTLFDSEPGPNSRRQAPKRPSALPNLDDHARPPARDQISTEDLAERRSREVREHFPE